MDAGGATWLWTPLEKQFDPHSTDRRDFGLTKGRGGTFSHAAALASTTKRFEIANRKFGYHRSTCGSTMQRNPIFESFLDYLLTSKIAGTAISARVEGKPPTMPAVFLPETAPMLAEGLIQSPIACFPSKVKRWMNENSTGMWVGKTVARFVMGRRTTGTVVVWVFDKVGCSCSHPPASPCFHKVQGRSLKVT